MKSSTYIRIVVIGIFLTLLGTVFIFLEATNLLLLTPPLSVFAPPLIGIGGSVAAAGFVGWYVSKELTAFDLNSTIRSIESSSNLLRTEHELILVFSMPDSERVRVEGKHSFTLQNLKSTGRTRQKITVYTDLGGWNMNGGFESVSEPDGNIVLGRALQAHVSIENGKSYFSKFYDLEASSPAKFVFSTYGEYKRKDRLVWTIQDLSADFDVRIINQTGISGMFTRKINHHRESEIIRQMEVINPPGDDPEQISFKFGSVVLPYQSFEIMWDLDRDMNA